MFLDRFVRFLLPRQDSFFVLLDRIGAKLDDAVSVFEELGRASNHVELAELAARLKRIESAADALCQELYEKLDSTFVTPIDREDLAHLAKALDDVIDSLEHSAALAALFRFDVLTEAMRHLVGVTTRTVTQISEAIRNLRDFHDPGSIRRHTVAVHALENQADLIYRSAIEALFRDSVDARELVRQKDILFSLETGVDACEDAMDIIRSVAVKNG